MGMFKYLKAVFRGAYKILFAYPKIRRYAKYKDRYSLQERYDYAKKLIRIAFKALDTEVVVEGLEKLNKDENYLFVSNHQSFMDALAIVTLFNDPMSFVVKVEAKKYPFAGKVCDFIEAIFVDRDNLRDSIKMIKECKDRLNRGTNVTIFPEGTRTRDENYMPGEYKAGALKSAYDTGKKIALVVVDGSYKALSKKYKGKQKMFVKIVEIIDSSVYKEKNTGELAEYIKDVTVTTLSEHRKLLD